MIHFWKLFQRRKMVIFWQGNTVELYKLYGTFFYIHVHIWSRVMPNSAYSNTWLLEMLLIVWTQVRLSKERKKGDKIVSDSQERAFWRVYRPPPGCLSSLEVVPVPTRFRPGLPRPPSRKRTLADLQREVRRPSIDFLYARYIIYLSLSLYKASIY